LQQVNSAWYAGDLDRAHNNSKRAKQWSIAAIVTHVITIAVVVGFNVVGVIIAVIVQASVASSYNSDYGNYIQ